MVNITESKAVNFYVCQFCKKEFISEQDIRVIIGQSPLCSWICRYRFYFTILSAYELKSLIYIAKLLKVRLKEGDAQGNLASKLSKYFTNKDLSNINVCSKAQAPKS